MSYIEEKKIKGNRYYYLSDNIRVSKDKWKKIRTYIGKDLSNLESAKNKLKQRVYVRPILSVNNTITLEKIKKDYLKKYNKNNVIDIFKKDYFEILSFIYNTNAIEGNIITLEHTKDIINKSKTNFNYKRRDIKEINNMKKCVDYILKSDEDVSLDFIKKLHKIQMDGVHSEAGKIRTKQNIISNYLPPKPGDLEKELSFLINWYNKAKSKLHTFELAVLIHLKLVKIHPFMDGNGRLARLLMNYIFIKDNFPILNVLNSEKLEYYLILMQVDSKRSNIPFIKYSYNKYIEKYYN